MIDERPLENKCLFSWKSTGFCRDRFPSVPGGCHDARTTRETCFLLRNIECISPRINLFPPFCVSASLGSSPCSIRTYGQAISRTGKAAARLLHTSSGHAPSEGSCPWHDSVHRPRLPACLPRTGPAPHTRWWCARPRRPAVFLLVLRTFNMHGRLFPSRNPSIRPYWARVLNPFLEMMVLPNGSMVGDWAQPRYFPQQNKGHDHGPPRGCSQERRRARSISRRTLPAIGLVRGGRCTDWSYRTRTAVSDPHPPPIRTLGEPQ